MLAYIIIAIIVVIAIGSFLLYAFSESEIDASYPVVYPPSPLAPPPPHVSGGTNVPVTRDPNGIEFRNGDVLRCSRDGAIAQIQSNRRIPYRTMKEWEAAGRPAYRDFPCDVFYQIPEQNVPPTIVNLPAGPIHSLGPNSAITYQA